VATSSRRGDFNVGGLIAAMTGGAAATIDAQRAAPGAVLLEDTAERPDAIRLHAHEVTGLAGLLGSGASGVLRRLFGVTGDAGEIRREGTPRRITSPTAAVRLGIGFVPGERRLGLVMNLTVRDNILLSSLDRLVRGPGAGLDRARCDRLVAELMETLDIRPRNPRLPVSALSGGNQQKVILAKWLAREVGVLLLEEPTQGVDVAAKAQIHKLIREFAGRGGGVLVRSSELDELTFVCDNILALHQGRITDRVERSDGFDEKRLHTAIGG
jgi:ABC-type sugar transport system ATPase subunit